ncbi:MULTISPECIES: ABC transporter ATP-binding protein [Bacillales]|jgi:peptide/nickel transport system ATP-binding protein|uniref:Peptide ABC transporter ATP-binding protein n=1 Tax=Brevibacillus aydinogluensis TaxID=927786 RepID=A0AA48MCE7_9BACL|nr:MULTISPECIES: ABC transporter ATP-binding protein [Bacillales]REK66954.1 MAG: peptide ABC transporter ATP-binding protein [Brevibacillus sp.]MDT3416304.1 peptide/nickel transport system ATP-binding protein [Brevibacillus aydinogluensis]NNV04430.1 ABC transporter ATP-binding protein [Brevibacillus sp. MCWH]UFJ62633.1 ABC transporter ATP-binding protein [Anoxybacillus sediminis]CAJ1004247.1 Peptide ABC transporter ATP-binding protein [Brevibacillus aydinogluensis]
MTTILEVEQLRTRFRTENGVVNVVDGVDFSIRAGETLGVVGESGCGKSVTSLSIMRLLPPNGRAEGTIRFNGTNLLELSEKEMQAVRGNDISMIFQEPMTSLNPLHTVGRQIEEAIQLHWKVSKAQARERAIAMLKAVGMPRAEEIYGEYPHQLSGGMRQRVMIAMAMACDPKLIIADEPTTALDVTIQAQILDLMRELKEKTGTSIMLITHDLGVVAEMCDRVIVMYAGQVVEETDVETLFEQPKHPYTIGLMKSIPELDEEREYLDTIPGAVPLPHQMPKGCRFAPRCAQAMPICREQPPELLQLDGHKCRCWLYAEGRHEA